jgi:hypothetical protein
VHDAIRSYSFAQAKSTVSRFSATPIAQNPTTDPIPACITLPEHIYCFTLDHRQKKQRFSVLIFDVPWVLWAPGIKLAEILKEIENIELAVVGQVRRRVLAVERAYVREDIEYI